MPGEYEIQIDETVPPVQHRPRRTPVMLRDDVIKKLKSLETAGVIARVDELTDWISSLVAFRKPKWVDPTLLRSKRSQPSNHTKSLPNPYTRRCTT